MPSTGFNLSERRSKVRYRYALDLQYRALGKRKQVSGVGRTINLSSRGVLIEVPSNHQVTKGLQLEVSMDWPVLLDGLIPLQLQGIGRVMRSDPSSFAVSFSWKPEFRTRKKEPGTSTDPIRRSDVA
jgi:hypothetical protein